MAKLPRWVRSRLAGDDVDLFGPEQKTVLPHIRRSVAQIDPGIRDAIRSCVCGERPWPLVMIGRPGVGKTCAALCILDYSDGEYFTVSDLCEKSNLAVCGRLLDRYGDAVTPDEFREQFIKTPPLLVLDELGLRSTVSDAHFECVYRAIELRTGLPFVVVSNASIEEVSRIYDARVASRLGSGTVVEVAGIDRRLQ